MDPEAAQSFNAVTGNTDENVAKFYLESAQNDVETAINMFLESGGQVPSSAMDASDGEPAAAQPEAAAPKLNVVSEKDDEEQR